MNIYTNGSYCPACGHIYAGSVQPLAQWETTQRGRHCHIGNCREELMPIEIDSSEALAAHAMNNPWD
jgi:hypothetical protein